MCIGKVKNIISVALSILCSFLFVVLVTYGATTIGTSIDTGGDLTVGGSVTISSDLTIDTTTFYADSTNNRVGIGTSTPTALFHVARQSGDTEGLFKVGTSTDDDLFVVKSDGKVGIGMGVPLAKLHIGDASVNNSSDSQILISRSVDDAVSGNGHAFSDSSQIDRAGPVSYNSYDARVNIIGSNNYGHYASFQSGPSLGTSGTIDDLFGFFSNPTISAGTVIDGYGLFLQNPNVTGGALTNNYGIYIVDQTAGSALNYAIYNAGTARIFSQGTIIGSNILSSISAVGTATKQIEVQSTNGTEAALRLYQLGQNYWDLKIPASTTRLDIAAIGGTIISMLNSGNVGIATTSPATKLEIYGGSVRAFNTASSTCDATTRGAIFYNEANDIFWGCKTSGWVRLDN